MNLYKLEQTVKKGLDDLKHADMHYLAELKEAFDAQDTLYSLIDIKYFAHGFRLKIGTPVKEYILPVTVEEIEDCGCAGVIKYGLETLKKEIAV